jgi:hypothetical protein
VADPYVFLQQRLLDILLNGRGVDGALGAAAQARAVAVGHFRAEFQQAPLGDAAYPKERFDRALRVQWLAETDEASNRNALDLEQILSARVTVSHGVIYGEASGRFFYPLGVEDPAAALLTPQQRALADARLVRRALEWPDLLRDGTETDPVPIGCEREGGTNLQELGGGKLLASSVYLLTYRTSDA